MSFFGGFDVVYRGPQKVTLIPKYDHLPQEVTSSPQKVIIHPPISEYRSQEAKLIEHQLTYRGRC